MIKDKKVVFVQRFMLHYRIDLLERINAIEGIDLTLIHGKGIENTKFVNYKGDVKFNHVQLKTCIYKNGGQSLVFFPSLFRKLIKIKPDVIITEGESNMLNNIIIYFYSLFFGKKIIWWGLGIIPGFKETLYQKLYRPFKLLFLKRAKFIIGYSEYSKEYYSSLVNGNKVIVANNCLDKYVIDKEISEYKDESVLEKKRLELSNKFVILYVGALVPTKKVDKLIKAYEEVKAAHPECALVIVGEGYCKEELDSYISEKNIKDVFFVGKVIEGVSKYFLLADLFVLPGLGGLSIYHALVHSLPVISACADGTERDLIKNGKNGYLLQNDTVNELTEKINHFLENKNISKEYGENSRYIVDNEINIDKKVDNFLKAIRGSLN